MQLPLLRSTALHNQPPSPALIVQLVSVQKEKAGGTQNGEQCARARGTARFSET